MKTITLEIELTYDDDMMHGGDHGDDDAKTWFFRDVLSNELELYEKAELGDEIGKVKVVRIIKQERATN